MLNSKGKRAAVKSVTGHDSATGKCSSFDEILICRLRTVVSRPLQFLPLTKFVCREGVIGDEFTLEVPIGITV